jgi:hypothetical protein
MTSPRNRPGKIERHGGATVKSSDKSGKPNEGKPDDHQASSSRNREV